MKLQRLVREDALGEDERPLLGQRDAKRRPRADQLLCLIGEEHIDVASLLFPLELGVPEGQRAVAEPPFAAQAVEEAERFLWARRGRYAARHGERRDLALGRGGGQHDVHIFAEILPALYGNGAVLVHGENENGEVMRVPVEPLGRAREEHLRLKAIRLDRVDALLAKELQKPLRPAVERLDVGRVAKERIAVGGAEALLIAERRRPAFPRGEEKGEEAAEKEKRQKSARSSVLSCHRPPLPLRYSFFVYFAQRGKNP